MKRLALFVGILGASAIAEEVRPNVFLCVTDDQSFPHASAYGTDWVRTPAFDRVAEQGLLFMRAYTPNAKCAPSRASLLTGRNSWQLEEAGNHQPYYPAGYRTFMEGLADSGYHVGYTGKGWAPGEAGLVKGRPRELTGPAFNSIETEPPADAMSNIDYAANFAEFLDTRPEGEPFCFWFGPKEPHRPYTYGSGSRLSGREPKDIDDVPAFWPDVGTVRQDMLDYASEIDYADHHLAEMIALLEERGELENTIIIVTSDNGMPFPRAKGANYELSHHVPMAIMWGAGVKKPGRRVEQYVSFVDIAPTVLEVTGYSANELRMEAVQGRSLLPLMREDSDWENREDRLLLGQERHDVGRPDDVGYPVRGVIEADFLYLRNFEPSRWPMGDPVTGYLNTDGSPTKTLILEHNRDGVNTWIWELNFGRRPPEELYNLKDDPNCLYNLVLDPVHEKRRESMRTVLFDALREQGDPRMVDQGEIFDRYPYGNDRLRGFYNRFVNEGERPKTPWVNPTDFEKPDFDPERPMTNDNCSLK